MLLSWLSLTLYISLASSVAIDTYFNIATGPDNVGGCDGMYNGRTGRQWILQWWAEAQTLTQTALTAGNNFRTSEATRENYLRFYGIGSTQTNTRVNNDPLVAGNWGKMNNFFRSPAPAKGWIFCSSAWLQQEADTSVARSASSTPNPRRLTIAQMYPGLTVGNNEAFWSPAVQEYYFGDPSTMSGYCTNTNRNYGGTLDYREYPPGTITLCMTSIFAAAGVDSLGATQPTAGQPLANFMSYGVTMLHELFHWVLSQRRTPDTFSTMRGTLSAAVAWANGNKATHPANLPESMAVFAEAQWLSMNAWPGPNPPTYVWNARGNARVL